MEKKEYFLNHNEFIQRHIGTSQKEKQEILLTLGYSDIEAFLNSTLPAPIRFNQELDIADGVNEQEALEQIRKIAQKNVVNKSYIGLGYYPTQLPTVLLRNILENPGWYTSYTPYQAEVSQGRLEALLNFQQLCIDLTGLPVAGASLLDEATAAAESMSMAKRISKSKSNVFFVDERIFPQTLDVILTRAQYFGFEVEIGDIDHIPEKEYFGALLQYLGTEGNLIDLKEPILKLKNKGTVIAVASDLLSLVLLKSPASLGADIALGSTQRFGLPMGFGGPHAAYFAFKEEYKRSAPGRMIGVSIDASGQTALRMALQTREQHIRREKATSNICTAQALLAILSGMYAVYHGSKGLKKIASRVHFFATSFQQFIETKTDYRVIHQQFFDTLLIDVGDKTDEIYQTALKNGFNLRKVSNHTLSIAFHEMTTEEDFSQLTTFFANQVMKLEDSVHLNLDAHFLREDDILTHPVFNLYHTEHEMLRYIKRLENKDISLARSMISLGSCTMKLNATTEMIPITWPEFSNIHPFAPKDQAKGYHELITGLENKLKAITGFDGISLQPNSGAQGEYTGLILIRRYLESIGQSNRNICLIPRSAHGTNPASAHMVGFKVIVVACDEYGNVDISDLKVKAAEHKDLLAAFMITYPSTHGVYEEGIKEICQIIHDHGGQVYMDGANMNAQVGLMRPADMGADVLHMNLHKTFCIPHGGGGPGVGPIGFKSHLKNFAPNHIVAPIVDAKDSMGAVSAAPYGSAGILPITWMYLTLMGKKGLKEASINALLNANYIASELGSDYPILYTGRNGRVAHECILDLRPIKEEVGITEVDIAKRLIDFGFHAPTMSFPVPGTLMIEPTESESKSELDRFIAAMRQIKKEVLKVKNGDWTLEDNPLVHSPHTAISVIVDWKHTYSREQGAYPLDYVKLNKYWPPVSRVDDVYGDRHLVCSCPPIEHYE